MKKRIAFLFPGQGAQVVGMGRDFYESFREAKEIFDEGESLLKTSLTKPIFEGPDALLKETRHSQTAIYVTSIAFLAVIKKQFPQLTLSGVAGLSLGEYSAMTASGKIPFSSCLPLVHYRGACMHEACERTQGTMAAILGFDASSVKKLVEELNTGELWVANVNSREQVVISGTVAGVEKGSLACKEKGARVIPLRVHGAFHSGLMRSAEEKLKEKLLQIEILKTTIPIVMNVTGEFVEEPDAMRQNLINQVTQSVLWDKTMETLKDKIDLFVEVGPGKTLAGLNKGREVSTISINKVGDLDLLNQYIG